jgi:predicted metal-dependent hydrolase
MGRGPQTTSNDEKRKHPYADAEYRVYRLDDGTFGIEVSLPDVLPTKITSFASRAAANQWIENHKKTVKEQVALAGQPMFGRRLGRKQTHRG